MIELSKLFFVADTYGHLTDVGEKTVSSRVFADSKKLSALRNGADITVGRFNAAFQWFSDHWPDDAAWPSDVERPVKTSASSALEAAQ